jgi:hypothetical protein
VLKKQKNYPMRSSITKKTLLTLSGYINLLPTYMAYATYTTRGMLNVGAKVHGVGVAFSSLDTQLIMMMLVGAIVFIDLGLFTKLLTIIFYIKCPLRGVFVLENS